MKRVLVENADKAEVIYDATRGYKRAYAEGEGLIVSDGYHTFDELYDHRITIFIALCKTLWMVRKMMEISATTKTAAQMNKDLPVWRSKLHADGSSFEGWFILGIGKESGEQITYHLPLSRWEDTNFVETLENAPEFDGHTPQDVINRLKLL